MVKKNRITIYGIVIPSEWQQNGKVSSVNIAGYDEHLYSVANDPMGKQLIACLKKRVIVDGLVEIIDNRKTICVQQIRIDTSNPVPASGQAVT